MKRTVTALAVAVALFSAAASAPLGAQWPSLVPAGAPRTADGRVDMAAPAPRAADGKPGTLSIEVTIDDPKAYTRPFTATINNRLLPDTQLIEFVCIDKSAKHYVGAAGK